MIDKLLVSVVVDDVFAGIFVSVPPGYVACIYDHGRGVIKKILKPGLHFKIPLWQKAKLFNVQTLEYTLRKELSDEEKSILDKSVQATTSDGKKLEIEGTVLFRLNEDKIPEIWQNVGEDFIEKVVKPITRNRLTSEIGTFQSEQIFSSQRHLIENAIQMKLKEAFESRGLILEDFLLGSITPVKEVKEESAPQQNQNPQFIATMPFYGGIPQQNPIQQNQTEEKK